MRHALHIRKRAGSGVENGVARLPVKGIVLDGAAVDQRPAIRQDDHSVAEHIPCQRLHDDGTGLGIPDSRLKIRVARDIPGPGDHKNFSGVEEGNVHRVDWHLRRQRRPLSLSGGLLGANRLAVDRDDCGQDGRCGDRPARGGQTNVRTRVHASSRTRVGAQPEPVPVDGDEGMAANGKPGGPIGIGGKSRVRVS